MAKSKQIARSFSLRRQRKIAALSIVTALAIAGMGTTYRQQQLCGDAEAMWRAEHTPRSVGTPFVGEQEWRYAGNIWTTCIIDLLRLRDW